MVWNDVCLGSYRFNEPSASTGADIRIDRRRCLKCCNCVIIIFDFELVEWWSGFLKVGIKKESNLF